MKQNSSSQTLKFVVVRIKSLGISKQYMMLVTAWDFPDGCFCSYNGGYIFPSIQLMHFIVFPNKVCSLSINYGDFQIKRDSSLYNQISKFAQP